MGCRFHRIENPLAATALASPERIAIFDSERTINYGDLHLAAAAFAETLTTSGVRPGDRVAIFLERSIEAVVALYGAWTAGAIAVPINEGLRSAQVSHILHDSSSLFLISNTRLLSTLDRATIAAVPVLSVDLARLPEAPLRAHETVERTPAVILYTSGSTGRPKGILISHGNLLAGARIVIRYLEITGDDRLLSVLPYSFDYGLNQLLTSVQQGAAICMQRSLLPADICRALERHRITGMAAVPTLWIQLMQRHSPFPQRAFPELRYITNSGGAFPVDLVQRYREHLPQTRIHLMYGLSEAFRSTHLPPEELDRRPGSMGKAIPETEILVIDEHGRECGPHAIGELVHAGPTVALGYWNRPTEVTSAVYRPHPLRPSADERVVYSGDLVKKDEDGFLTFVGRRDQQIKTHGIRVSPEEVEEIVHASGMVAEVIVRGIPDSVAGAAIVAHVVPRAPDTFSRDALLDYCRDAMPRYMVPKQIELYTAFQRTSSGKVDRAAV
jgi:amino acid adenylation domain-containing protein